MTKCRTTNFIEKFLVVASGENSAENIPMIPGLQSFLGETIHSSIYKSGRRFFGENVFVVGSRNSGMEIIYDLACHGANFSIIIKILVCSLCIKVVGMQCLFHIIERCNIL